jgi:serine/threonine protein kinase/tetratricopeptide (TPR) repeat protein
MPSPQLGTHLISLLQGEQRRRWEHGERVPVETYLEQHPTLQTEPEGLLDLVYNEILIREEQGDRPGLEEYQRRFPEFASQLQVQFAVHGALRAGRLHRTILYGQASLPPMRPAATSPELSNLPPVPGYEVLGELGRGGMGIVYKARQVRLKRLVALKMILAGSHPDAEILARFLVEAETVARLQHPNIVQIHEIGEYKGQPYLCLELVEGGSLAQLLAAAPLPARPAAELVETLARAVHVAHERGIVHRDLKPANILLQPNPKSEIPSMKSETRKPKSEKAGGAVSDFGFRFSDFSPKVTDFGLAKRLDVDSGQTQRGSILGTPSYMAPEQAEGKVDQLGPAVDGYALGAILYEILTGRPPFKGATPLETLVQVQTQEPVPPRRLQPTVPRDLETIYLKCLEKDPAKRYPSALELADDLRGFLTHQPIRARPVGRPERLWRWCRRKPLVAGLTATLIVVLCGAVASLSWLWLRAEHLRGVAEAKETKALENFRLARQAVDDYSLKVSNDRRLAEHFPPLRKELLLSAVPFYERLVARGGDGPEMRAELARACQKLGSLTQAIDGPNKAIARYEQAVALLERLSADFPAEGRYQAELADANLGLGGLLLETGQSVAAKKALQAALDLRRGLAEQSMPGAERQAGLAAALSGLAYLYLTTHNFVEAEKCYREAIHHLRQLVQHYPARDEYRVSLARSYRSLGVLYSRAGPRTKKQESAYRECLALCRALVARHPDRETYQQELAVILGNLGILYGNTSRFREGEHAYRQALAIKRLLAEKHPELTSYQRSLVHSMDDLGTLYSMSGRLEKAETIHRQAVPLLQRLVDRYPEVVDHAVNLAGGQTNLAAVVRNRNKDAESLELFDRAIRTLEAVVRKETRHAQAREFLSIAHEGRAKTLKKLGRHAEAVGALNRALAYEDGPARTKLRVDRAWTKARAGDLAGALAESDALLKKPAALGPGALFTLGSTHLLLADQVATESHLPAAERERRALDHRSRAMALFERARRVGYFNDAKSRKSFLTDEELAPLWSRADFQELVRVLRAMR